MDTSDLLLYTVQATGIAALHACFMRGNPPYRPIANMATISPKQGFSVATVARVWLPVLTCAIAAKTAASQASFPLNSTKISHFSSLKEVSIWYVRFEYCFSMLN